MKRFFQTVSFAALLFFLPLVFLACPLAFFLPYEKDDYLQAFFIKEKMLVEHTPPTIFLLGGSSLAFGFASEQLEKAVHLPVVNLGLHAGVGLEFMIDYTAPHLKTGDVLILSPEYSHFYGSAYGEREALADVFYLSKSKILPYLGAKQIKVILENTPSTMIKRIRELLTGRSTSNYAVSWFNSHGDVVGHKDKASKRYRQTQSFRNPLDQAFLDYFCQRIEELRRKGVAVILFPPPLAETSFKNIQKDMLPLTRALEERNIPFVLPPEDFAFPDSLFFDTSYHLSYQGALLRTQKVTDCLIQQELQLGEKP